MTPSTASIALEASAQHLIEEYKAANTSSAEAFEQAKKAGIAGGTNRASIFHSPFPLTFVDATEATARTADGQDVTDFLGNFTAGLFGFSPVPVQRAVADAMQQGHALGGAHNLTESAVANIFTQRFAGMDQVRFSNTGTEANCYAINTARAVTGKTKVMMYEGAYHGAWIHGGRSAGPLDLPYEKITVAYGDAERIVATIYAEQDDLAAVIIEPVMVNAFVYLKQVAPRAYMQRIREACSAVGCALIFDEVMTSRLAPGGAQELLGVTPDMTTFGKYFGGGLPFGGFGGGKAWMQRHDPLHPQSINSGGTFNQNAICLAAVKAVCEELWTAQQCVSHNAKGDWFRTRINQLAQQYSVPCQACGTGSLITLIWQQKPVVGQCQDSDEQHQLGLVVERAVYQCTELFWFYMLLRHNILAGSPKLNYLTLPTVLTDDDYQQFLNGMEQFFTEYRDTLTLLAKETVGC